jgi:hypothetical protein
MSVGKSVDSNALQNALNKKIPEASLGDSGYNIDGNENALKAELVNHIGITDKEASALINIAQEASSDKTPKGIISYIIDMLNGAENYQVITQNEAMNSDITYAVQAALQGLAPNGKFDAENPTDIKNLMEITGISEKDVKDLITKTGGDVSELMILMFDVDGDTTVGTTITISELDENKGSDYYDAMQKLMEDSMKKEADAIKNTTNTVQAASDTVKSLAQSMKSKPTAARSGNP